MRFRETKNDLEWQELLDRRPDALLYHCLPWLRFQARSFGYKLVLLIGHQNGHDTALMPLMMTRKGPFRVAASPKGIDYLMLGPLVDKALVGQVLDGYEDWAKSNSVDYTSMAWTLEIDQELATSRDYQWERHINCIVELDGGKEAIFSRMHSECRRRIRQAQNNAVEVIEGDLKPWLSTYVQLSEQIFGRTNKKNMLTESVLEDMVRTLKKIGPTLSIRAEINGKLAGMYIGAGWRDKFYALDTVWDRQFHRFSPSNAMNWYALQWACQQGFREFDMGGGRINNLRKFKEGFGARLMHYSNIQKSHSWRARMVVESRKLFNGPGRRVAH